VAAARAAGIGYVPRDRRGRGLLPQLSVAENLTAAIQSRLGRAGFISPQRRNSTARQLRTDFGVVCASLAQPVAELSGGNQQKVMMGRALSSAPKVLVLVYPTQGVDVAAKGALFTIIAQAQEQGTGVLLISDEADELQGCDRILVVHKGRLVREFQQDWTERDLVAAMEGV
jgi:simple sugar transport system ATP-binding protein